MDQELIFLKTLEEVNGILWISLAVGTNVESKIIKKMEKIRKMASDDRLSKHGKVR